MSTQAELPGDALWGDVGVQEVAEEMGTQWLGPIRLNEFDTPLVHDAFAVAAKHAKNDLLCYVNADIILLDQFIEHACAAHPLR